MQPTYIPWMGYFGLMMSVDLFVLLDSVQFSKRSWQQRNQIKSNSGPQWLTVPVHTKGKRDQLIVDVHIDLSREFHLSHIRALEINYRKSIFFDEIFPLLKETLLNPPETLLELNIRMIELIRGLLGINTPLMRSSTLLAGGENALLLANICLELGATEYISPPGSRVYLDETNIFEKIKIPVEYFDFQCLPYTQQFGEFLPFMSTVDLLFNCGSSGKDFIQKGITKKYDT